MPAGTTKLYSLSFLVKRIHFEPADDVADETIAASVTFLRYRERAVFKPVARPPSGTLDVHVGKSFTFGVDRDTARALADRFVVDVHLDRHRGDLDEPQRLSEARVDVTRSFREVLKDHCCSNNAKAQVKTTVHFHDDANAKIAHMEILLRLTPSGQTIVNEFNLDGNVDKQKFAMTKGCKCPDFKSLDANRQDDDDDDDDWDIVGAELNNGQKIAIKYKKDYYQFEPNSEFDGQCESPEVKPTESEERLNKYILKLVDQMHRMVAANISGVSERKN